MTEKIKTIIEYTGQTIEERRENCKKALSQYINNKIREKERKTVDSAHQKVV